MLVEGDLCQPIPTLLFPIILQHNPCFGNPELVAVTREVKQVGRARRPTFDLEQRLHLRVVACMVLFAPMYFERNFG